jgi:hypothetical protein
VPVLPKQRNFHPIHMLERIRGDRPAVGALEASLRGVAAKVSCSHFDCFLLSLFVEVDSAPTEPACCCSLIGQLSDPLRV